jgi:hypothetical protein
MCGLIQEEEEEAVFWVDSLLTMVGTDFASIATSFGTNTIHIQGLGQEHPHALRR